jgi:hypothetical protein
LQTAIEQTFINIESRQLCEILLKKSENIVGANPITERLHQAQRSFTSQMQYLLNSAISKGEVDPMLDIDVTCRMLQMYLSGLFFECLQCNLDVPSHIKNALDIIVEMLLKPPARLLTPATTLAIEKNTEVC